jgi:hypothetical protein
MQAGRCEGQTARERGDKQGERALERWGTDPEGVGFIPSSSCPGLSRTPLALSRALWRTHVHTSSRTRRCGGASRTWFCLWVEQMEGGREVVVRGSATRASRTGKRADQARQAVRRPVEQRGGEAQAALLRGCPGKVPCPKQSPAATRRCVCDTLGGRLGAVPVPPSPTRMSLKLGTSAAANGQSEHFPSDSRTKARTLRHGHARERHGDRTPLHSRPWFAAPHARGRRKRSRGAPGGGRALATLASSVPLAQPLGAAAAPLCLSVGVLSSLPRPCPTPRPEATTLPSVVLTLLTRPPWTPSTGTYMCAQHLEVTHSAVWLVTRHTRCQQGDAQEHLPRVVNSLFPR